MSEVRFEEVALADGRRMLYQDLSFTLHPGQLGAVYGPSRTGKSSLLLLASGHMQPTKGRVAVDGKAPDRKRVGLGPVRDLTPLFDTLTVYEHLVFQARLHHVRQPKERAQELMRAYDLLEVKKYRVKEIGRLAQFRVGLATALVHRPSLILIDEPERGLTNEEWGLAHGDLAKLAEEGHAVLLTTVLSQVADACSLVIELPSGEVRD